MKTNMKVTHFPFPTMTKINGFPTYADIQTNRLEAFANLGSVPMRIGDSKGYLAPGMIEAMRTRNGITDFTRPTNPGTFGSPKEKSDKDLQTLKEEHKEKLDDFHEANLVERTVLNQILNAFDRNVLRAKINRLTGVIDCSIPDFYEYLFQSYGNITDLALAEKRQSIITYQYVHSESIHNTFDTIQEYADMAEAHGTPETQEQLMSIAMIILIRANIFTDAIMEWNKKEKTSKSWTTFQDHFIQAQIAYTFNRNFINSRLHSGAGKFQHQYYEPHNG